VGLRVRQGRRGRSRKRRPGRASGARNERAQVVQFIARGLQPAGAELGRSGVHLRGAAPGGDGLQGILGGNPLRRGLALDVGATPAETFAEFCGHALDCEAESGRRFQLIARGAEAAGQPGVAHLTEECLVPVETGRLDALPAVLRRIEGRVHDAHMGVQLRVEFPTGFVGDDGGHEIAGHPVAVGPPGTAGAWP
jgi:hypothetical protein